MKYGITIICGKEVLTPQIKTIDRVQTIYTSLCRKSYCLLCSLPSTLFYLTSLYLFCGYFHRKCPIMGNTIISAHSTEMP